MQIQKVIQTSGIHFFLLNPPCLCPRQARPPHLHPLPPHMQYFCYLIWGREPWSSLINLQWHISFLQYIVLYQGDRTTVNMIIFNITDVYSTLEPNDRVGDGKAPVVERDALQVIYCFNVLNKCTISEELNDFMTAHTYWINLHTVYLTYYWLHSLYAWYGRQADTRVLFDTILQFCLRL